MLVCYHEFCNPGPALFSTKMKKCHGVNQSSIKIYIKESLQLARLPFFFGIEEGLSKLKNKTCKILVLFHRLDFIHYRRILIPSLVAFWRW